MIQARACRVQGLTEPEDDLSSACNSKLTVGQELSRNFREI